MKKSMVYIGNISAIIVGLLGLNTPYVTDAVIAIGIGGFMDPSLLQPLFIGFIILAVMGQFYKVKESMAFMPLILEFVIGVIGFIFIFPVKVEIVGYLALVGIIYIMISPYISKMLNKKNINKIKA